MVCLELGLLALTVRFLVVVVVVVVVRVACFGCWLLVNRVSLSVWL